MTAAVCLQGGAIKLGAWTPCDACNYLPNGLDQEARSLWLTDHYRDRAQLEEASARIKKGEEPDYDPVFLETVTAVARAEGKDTMVPEVRGCTLVLFAMAALFLVVVVLMTWAIYR